MIRQDYDEFYNNYLVKFNPDFMNENYNKIIFK